MRNLISRSLFSFLLIILHTANAAGEQDGLLCVKEKLGERLVKIHKMGENSFISFFVVSNDIQIQSLEKLIKKIERCLTGKEWETKWDINVFSRKELAFHKTDYEDDPTLLPFLQSGEWARGYLAQYESRTRILTLYPVLPDKIKFKKLHGIGRKE